ncbi:hypothetical protein SUGI_0730910 [Cryptomeria japonica]|nr:hypothetical protein SUGI_0730910 [Cryptomeria japonica]
MKSPKDGCAILWLSVATQKFLYKKIESNIQIKCKRGFFFLLRYGRQFVGVFLFTAGYRFESGKLLL